MSPSAMPVCLTTSPSASRHRHRHRHSIPGFPTCICTPRPHLNQRLYHSSTFPYPTPLLPSDPPAYAGPSLFAHFSALSSLHLLACVSLHQRRSCPQEGLRVSRRGPPFRSSPLGPASASFWTRQASVHGVTQKPPVHRSSSATITGVAIPAPIA